MKLPEAAPTLWSFACCVSAKKPEASAASSTQRHRDRRGLSTSEISSGKAEMASPLTTSDGFENLKFTEQKVLTLAVKNDANEVRRF